MNLAFLILKEKQKASTQTKIGFSHEVFKLCCKLDCLDVWLKTQRDKENPLKTIKRLVESYYLKKDIAKCQASQSMFNTVL